MLVQILHDGPCNGDAVVGRGAATQLVEEHQRARCDIVQDVGGLGHLDHECRFAQRDIVGGAHTGEYFVHQTDSSALCGHEAAYLGQQYDEGRLAQQRRFTGHIRSGDDDNLLFLVVQVDVVGHIPLPYRQLFLDDRMASLPDIQLVGRVDDRPHVVVFLGALGKRQQTVELCHEAGVQLNGLDILLHCLHQFGEEARLQRQYFLLGAKDFLLIFLQFLSDIALGLCQSLLANPVLRHLVLIGVAHLEIIAEHVVIAYLQRGDACLLGLALLDAQQVVLTVLRDVAQVVELGVISVANHMSFVHQLRRVVHDLVLNALTQVVAEAQPLPYSVQYRIVGTHARRLHASQTLQGHLQLHHLAGRHPSDGHFRHDALEVAHALQLTIYQLFEFWLAEEILHHVEAFVDGFLVFQGEHHPSAQQSSAHRRYGLVDDVEQRDAALLHGIHQLERADGELVEAHIFLFLDAREAGDMTDLRVLGLLQVVQDGTCGNHTVVQMVHSKALQVLHAEVLQQLGPCRLVGEHPVVELEHTVTGAEHALEVVAPLTVVEHLLGLEIG